MLIFPVVDWTEEVSATALEIGSAALNGYARNGGDPE